MPPQSSQIFKLEFQRKIRSLNKALDKYSRDELIIGIVTALKEADSYDAEDYKNRKPKLWTLLTLLRLAFEYANRPIGVKPQYNDLVQLYNLVYDIEGDYDTAIAQEYGYGVLITLAHRQFWGQQHINRAVFSRLHFIFARADCDKSDAQQFAIRHGLSFRMFCEMLATLWVIVNIKKQLLYEIDSHFLNYGHNRDEIDAFLSLMSIHIDNSFSTFADIKQRESDEFFKFGASSPFVSTPLIRISNTDYAPVSLRTVERSIEVLPLKIMRTMGDEKLRRRISSRYELYIKQLLSESGIEHLSSGRLEKSFSGKTTDFLISHEDTIVMIEAKSIHLGDHSISNPSPHIIPNELGQTVIKAIRQGHEFCGELRKTRSVHSAFLIIVTYLELYLGDPHTCWHTYFKRRLPDYNTASTIGPLQHDHIYIVSAHQMELILSSCSTALDLINLITLAVNADRDPVTRKHSLDMHVDEACTRTHPFVDKCYHEAFAGVIARAKSAS